MTKVIEIENLTKTYGKHRGVEKVSFSVEKSEIFGFLGPNGAGKSTTIRSMLGMLRYEQGTIKLLGRDANKERTELLKEIGYMPSEAMFYSDMRVKDIIKLAADMRKKDCEAEAYKLCERLQIDTQKKKVKLIVFLALIIYILFVLVRCGWIDIGGGDKTIYKLTLTNGTEQTFKGYDKLYGSYSENKLANESLYEGARIEITAKSNGVSSETRLVSIGKLQTQVEFVTFSDARAKFFYNLEGDANAANIEILSSIKSGDTIKVTGKIRSVKSSGIECDGGSIVKVK